VSGSGGSKDEGGKQQQRSVSATNAPSKLKSPKKSTAGSSSSNAAGAASSSRSGSLKASIQHVGADAAAAGHPNGLIHLSSGAGAGTSSHQHGQGQGQGRGTGGANGRMLLAGDDRDFRTSLILVRVNARCLLGRHGPLNFRRLPSRQPHLTKRFTLLRAEDGSLVSLDQMQAHLR